MQFAALIVVIAASLWLAGVGALMAFRPAYGLELMERTTVSLEASNWRLNVIEQGLRIVAGTALLVRAPASKLPTLFEIAGWILVTTSIVVIIAPVRWHGAYGRALLRRLSPLAVRVLSPVPVLASAGLIYTAL